MLRLVPFVILAGLVWCAPARAGEFAEACVSSAGGAASQPSCECQEKLAQSMLNAQEMAAIIASANDKKTDYVAAINAMNETQAADFRKKLQDLAEAVDAKCPQ